MKDDLDEYHLVFDLYVQLREFPHFAGKVKEWFVNVRKGRPNLISVKELARKMNDVIILAGKLSTSLDFIEQFSSSLPVNFVSDFRYQLAAFKQSLSLTISDDITDFTSYLDEVIKETETIMKSKFEIVPFEQLFWFNYEHHFDKPWINILILRNTINELLYSFTSVRLN